MISSNERQTLKMGQINQINDTIVTFDAFTPLIDCEKREDLLKTTGGSFDSII